MLLNTPACDLGRPAPLFELPDPDGQIHALADYLQSGPVLLAFICNHCPYVQAIADRLAADADTLKTDGIHTLAVMSNDYDYVPADRPEEMKRFAAAYGFHFPYLVDRDQTVAQAYGAVCTPDFFGLDAQGTLQYRGRLDDAGRGSAQVRRPELLEAMREIAATGKTAQAQHPSIGCSIKWRG